MRLRLSGLFALLVIVTILEFYAEIILLVSLQNRL